MVERSVESSKYPILEHRMTVLPVEEAVSLRALSPGMRVGLEVTLDMTSPRRPWEFDSHWGVGLVEEGEEIPVTRSSIGGQYISFSLEPSPVQREEFDRGGGIIFIGSAKHLKLQREVDRAFVAAHPLVFEPINGLPIRSVRFWARLNRKYNYEEFLNKR